MIRRDPTRIELKLEDLQEFDFIAKYDKKKAHSGLSDSKIQRQERIGFRPLTRISQPSSSATQSQPLASSTSSPAPNSITSTTTTATQSTNTITSSSTVASTIDNQIAATPGSPSDSQRGSTGEDGVGTPLAEADNERDGEDSSSSSSGTITSVNGRGDTGPNHPPGPTLSAFFRQLSFDNLTANSEEDLERERLSPENNSNNTDMSMDSD